jgi:cupin fold WbuC family metalloprotein
MMKHLQKRYPDVWFSEPGAARIGKAEIEFLKERAAESPRLRARICFHENHDSPIQEMLIVHHRSCYVRPASHPYKAESLFILEGAAVAVLFDNAGTINDAFRLGSPYEADTYFWRVPQGTWHSIVIASEWLVFSEVSAGPFREEANLGAPWAPTELEGQAYFDELRTQLRARGLLTVRESATLIPVMQDVRRER